MPKTGKVVAVTPQQQNTVDHSPVADRRNAIREHALPTQHEPNSISGKYVIIAIFALALTATSFAVWYRYQQSNKAIVLWSPAHAERIRNGTVVEVWRVQPATETGSSIPAPDGTQVEIVSKRVLENIPDLNYIRRAFLTDAFVLWEAPEESCTLRWAYVLQFSDAQGATTTLWLDEACDEVQLAETSASAKMNPPLYKSVRAFLDRHAPPDRSTEPLAPKKTSPPS